jgi:hypothetical protein
MTLTDDPRDTDVAASTVGKLLVVAIVVVVLAGGAVFLLGGERPDPSSADGSPTATATATATGPGPSTSLRVEQRELVYEDTGAGKGERELTTLVVFHEGGDAIDVSRTTVTVNGEPDVWRIAYKSGWDQVYPVPNVWETRDTNSSVLFLRNGLTTRVVAYDCHDCENSPMPDPHNITPGDGNSPELHYYIANDGYNGSGTDPVTFSPWTGGGGPHYDANVLQSGDEFSVSWTAASGEETATLLTYTVE